jgi:hypothetical protein
MIDILAPIGYKAFRLNQNQLLAMENADAIEYEGGDFYFKVN